MKSVIVGTAGHIDHGKTALVKALTGIDADRLQEEKRRGITIELQQFLRGSFLDSAPIVPVSSKNGTGMEELKRALIQAAGQVPQKDSAAYLRLPIDRVFTMKGFGTVITGTLIAGSVAKEDEVEVFPSHRRVRVRGVQVHGAPAERALAGQRTALNLAAVATEDLARGMTLAAP